MHNPLVSIIIPTFNRAHLISETIDSIRAQSYQNWECIIVDDGSNDDTEQTVLDYIKKDSRIQFHHRPENRKKGANACRNYGFELSKGEFINWFDSDDVMLPDFLIQKIDAFEENINLVISSGYYCNEFLVKSKPIELIQSTNLFKDYVLWRIHILTPSVIFRKKILDGIKLFNLDISRGQETEFFSRFFFEKQDAIDYKILKSYHFLYRLHGQNNSFKDKIYNYDNQNSVSYIYKLNLERGFLLEDKEIVNLFYSRLISMWFRSMRHKDLYNMKFILNALTENFKTNKWLCFKIKIVFSICAMLRFDSFRLRNHLKNINAYV